MSRYNFHRTVNINLMKNNISNFKYHDWYIYKPLTKDQYSNGFNKSNNFLINLFSHTFRPFFFDKFQKYLNNMI